MGRRHPFILAGSLMIFVVVVLIGFSADIGYLLVDTHEHCRAFVNGKCWSRHQWFTILHHHCDN
ncbi:hypothetical protein RchiOBHm_Chr2g0094581 [Rosa chinensis]|uniref:Transmembrane protein n=2 Tax=Rosa chinensis TaxID=74649 RepID=A0A2P6RKJ9_ROSCH|nr:hypothetical protein RchiOBHm_Chr2g0094581 [Rosa chinensis]